MSSIIISALALAVAIYGILERQRAAYISTRVRLTELLGTIESLNLEQLKDLDEHPERSDKGHAPPRFAPYGFASRRVLLTYQALELVRQLSSQRGRLLGGGPLLTQSEHGALAYSLASCGDREGARAEWLAALTTRTGSTTGLLAAMKRGYGALLFDLGELAEARKQYRESAQLEAGQTEADNWQAFNVYLEWLQHEKALEDGTPEVPVGLARSVANRGGPWAPMMLSELKNAATTTAYSPERGAYYERVIGTDDTPLTKHHGPPAA